jgi:glutamate-1-semialdehyde 2,1-aminomutase
MQFGKSVEHQARFHELIPGGSHTYAKGDDQFPQGMAPYIARGQGCHVWDLDGNEFIEYGMGLRAVTLGHARADVTRAATEWIEAGSNFVRPALIELQCAEAVHSLIPCAEMVKFGKHGSDVTSAAVKLSRAHTGRDLVAICSDHPFFSVEDWFIGTTPMSAGVPAAIRDLTVGFLYNDIENLRQLFQAHPGRIACVMLEAERSQPPLDGYLAQVRELCHREGAVLVFDEMITGFRWHNGGAQAFHGVTPDLAAFGKGMANGFAVSALAGRRDIMRLGGLDHEGERVFLLSTTHGAETHGLAAALATIKIFREEPVVDTLWRQGDRLMEGLRATIAARGLKKHFTLSGRSCCLLYGTLDATGKPCQGFRTLFLQETIRRGLLAPSFVVSYAHANADIDRTIEIVDAALQVYARALEGGLGKFLEGRPVQPVFRRFNAVRPGDRPSGC